ncbi:MAG TPA: hypothetical protein V6C97_23700 [Oculatellaceae cyanobacterium]
MNHQERQSLISVENVGFEALARHSSSQIRAVLASSQATPSSILRVLADDSEISVRLAAILNSACPIDVLEKLSNDPTPRIRLGLANQLDVCDDILLALSAHQNPYLAAQAKYAIAAAMFERKVEELQIPIVSTNEHQLGRLLVLSNLLTESDLKMALSEARSFNLRLGRVLLQLRLVKASLIVECLRLQWLLRSGEIDYSSAVHNLKHAQPMHFAHNEFLD